jgi:hypothetical protein
MIQIFSALIAYLANPPVFAGCIARDTSNDKYNQAWNTACGETSEWNGYLITKNITKMK